MNTFKRYLAIVATAIICTASLPLMATKRKNNPVTPSDEIEKKKYKIAPKQISQNQPKSEKISGVLGESFYKSMNHLNNVAVILNKTYEKEKNTPIEELPKNSLRQTLKKNNVPEEVFLQQLKTYFCPEAIQFFTSWCETTKDSEENDQLFESVINYVLKHENEGSFFIYNEIKNILDKGKIQYPTIEEFNKKCTKQDPKKRGYAWDDYIEKTKFHSDTITLSDFPIFKKCIDTTAQEMGVEIKSIHINNCTSTAIITGSKSLKLNINEILHNHYTDNEIKATLQHEYTHLKNNDRNNKIPIIVTSFLKSASKKNLMGIINNENSINFIQQNTTFISNFYLKTKELVADKGAYDKKNTIHLIKCFAKDFIELRKISNQTDPIIINSSVLECNDHIPLKQRIIFWIKKLRLQYLFCFWNTPKEQDNKYRITAWFRDRQEYINFAINTLLIMDFVNNLKNTNKTLRESFEGPYWLYLKTLKAVFQYAVENGCLTIVQEFFNPENKTILDNISNPDLGWALKYASQNGHLNIVQEFFNPENKTILDNISNPDLGWTLKYASQNGHLNIVQEFFKPANKTILDKISNPDLGWALNYASKYEHLNIIQAFFKPSNRDILNRISDVDLNISFQIAAIKGNKTIIQQFFNNDIVMSVLTQEELKEALNNAKTDEIKKEIEKRIEEKNKWTCNIQ